jgi:predicted aspartyl protease
MIYLSWFGSFVLRLCSKTVALSACALFILACESDGDALHITGSDTHAPVQAMLVHGSLLVVSAYVNDSINLDMLVDTGASGTYVPAAIFGNDGSEVHISSLCLENDICFKNFTAQSSDSGFTQSTEGYFNGIIGMDLLRNFDITFDYKSRLIYFYDTLENVPATVVSIPFNYQSNRPFTNVSIEGLPRGNNLLDTGAAFTRITSQMLDALIQEPEVLFKSVVFTLNGSEIVEYMPLTDYCIGIACPEKITAQVGDWPAIGGTFFREYLTIFKFAESVVHLGPYNDRSHIKESGIQRMGLQINIFDASDIIYVNENSFAWEGGLVEGDEISSVNGIPIDSLDYFGIYALLEDTSIMEYQFLVRTPEGDLEEVAVLAY